MIIPQALFISYSIKEAILLRSTLNMILSNIVAINNPAIYFYH